MSKPTLLCSLAAAILSAPTAHAQQILEIDFDSGRTIIDDEWRAMMAAPVAVDWERNILYVDDAEEPEGIMAFSLETGEWLRTISTPKGEGPYEFPQRRNGIALAPGGGLYVSGHLRVVEYDSQGMAIHSWRPEATLAERVCNFGGVPAVPTYGGVVRRGPDGTSELVGPVSEPARAEDAVTIRDPDAYIRFRGTRIACLGDVAYVAMSNEEGPDSVFVYHGSGEEGRVAVPVRGVSDRTGCMRRYEWGGEVIEEPCPHWSERARLSFDDRDNIVLLGYDNDTHGAIINPDTGCHALIRNTTRGRHTPIGIHADSVLVFHDPFEVTEQDGRTVYHITGNSAYRVSMHPLRRESGEPCPGMLPSVR
ncbi:MAG: hypothetical protein OXL34_16940 [Gemmatimonadota bacterium]|nr:hypothetical protein [Gemmatimonadota bacterium]